MDPTDELPLSTDNNVKAAWRCQHCQQLMYNVDQTGHPVPGAPSSSFVNSDYQAVCLLCFSLYHNMSFSHSYWQNLHEEWKKNKSNVDRLTGRTDYFTGA